MNDDPLKTLSRRAASRVIDDPPVGLYANNRAVAAHTFGDEDFQTRDKSRNVSWLAIASFGESWHNLHHADPTCARHGALKGQIDQSARVIRWFEQLGWATNVNLPTAEQLAARRA